MTAHHLEVGRRGEEIAAGHLKALGWKILARNLSSSSGELDIVARDGRELVVVEVRTRFEGWMQRGEESVGPRKVARLVREGQRYVDSVDWTGPWRIDVVSVTLRRCGEPVVERFEDVTSGGDAW